MARLPLFPEQASSIAPQIDALLYFLLGITAVFGTLIAGLIVYFLIRYRRRSADERPAGVQGSLALEGAWTIIPFAITMVVFFWGASLFASLSHPPEDAMQVHVVGKQWMWKVQHMEGKKEIDELHVP